MKTILKLRITILKKILGLFGLCSACFLFEACYGSPQGSFAPDYNPNPAGNIELKGTIKSENTLQRIPNLEVNIASDKSSEVFKTSTSATGDYSQIVTALKNSKIKITIKDVDGELNGSFENLEKTIDISSRDYSLGKRKSDILLKKKV